LQIVLTITYLVEKSRVYQYDPELDKWVRRHLKSTNDSWRVDETYVEVKG